jgi:transcriptional regulator with GAF, ATPase, and Fis domain
MAREDDPIQLERDLLLRILDLVHQDDPSVFVDEALGLVVARVGAERGYLALSTPPDDPLESPAWHALRGFDDPTSVRRVLSGTVVADALRSGKTVSTGSASADPRYAAADSVRRNAIEAVLCVPIGAGPEIVGVLYLQGAPSQGSQGGAPNGKKFPADGQRLAERLAHHLAPVARKLVRLSVATRPDPTATWRARLLGADALIGRSSALAEVLKGAALVAPLDVPVLLTGPSGTGKTALARVIVQASKRARAPLIELNCAAIPDELLESELFGAAVGAHSTAKRKVTGKVEAANGGTLFLDEVGELSPGAQAKLLQLLADGTYFTLGSSTPRKADVRVIAATNADLEARVAAGTFRDDLFYRLRVMPIRLPGLDERRGDIGALADAFLAVVAERHGLGQLALAPLTHAALERAEWPGHVRELAHAIEAAAIRASADAPTRVSAGAEIRTVEPEHVFPGLPASEPAEDWHRATRSFQRSLLTDALARSGGSVGDAARRLGIARSYAYDLMRALGLRATTTGKSEP